MIKIILSFTIILFISGCSIPTPPYEDIPKTKEDFKLSKNEILNKFPAIANHHIDNSGENNKTIPKYKDMISYWGKPTSKKKEWTKYIWNVFHLSSMIGVALEEYFYDSLFFGGTMIAINPSPPVTYTWEKGDYLIDTTCIKVPFINEKRCAYWNWKNKEDNSPVVILPKPDESFYFKTGYSSGGDKILKVDNSTITHSVGFGTTFQLGYSYKLFQDILNKINDLSCFL